MPGATAEGTQPMAGHPQETAAKGGPRQVGDSLGRQRIDVGAQQKDEGQRAQIEA